MIAEVAKTVSPLTGGWAQELVEAVGNVRVVGLDEAGLRSELESVRRVQAAAEGLVCRIGVEADRLSSQGHSAPAEELLKADGRVAGRTAVKQAQRARTVDTVSGLSSAVLEGGVGVDQIDSLTRQFNRLSEEERARIDETALVEKAKALSADRFDRTVKSAIDRARQDHGLQDAVQKREASEFRHWFDDRTGMGKFSGQLDPERYEALTSAVDAHTASLAGEDNTTVNKGGNLAAAALLELVCRSGSRSSRLAHITIVVDHKTVADQPHPQSVCQTGNGHPIPPETVERLGCDAVLQRVALDKQGVPINVGRKYRTATNAQWTAIRSVYSTCGWPGCARPLSWCQLHHITEWAAGGPTDLNNLVPLCNTHHHRVHEGKWTIKLKPDRSLHVSRPDGRPHSVTNQPHRKPNDALALLEACPQTDDPECQTAKTIRSERLLI